MSDEWLPECPNRTRQHTKVLHIKHMRPAEKTRIDSLLSTAYRLRYDAQLFADDYNVNEQQMDQGDDADDDDVDEDGEEEEEEELSSSNCAQSVAEDDENEDEDDDDDEDEDEDDGVSATISTSSGTVSSYQQVLSIAKLQMQQRRKHPRKPPKATSSQRGEQQLVPTDALVPI